MAYRFRLRVRMATAPHLEEPTSIAVAGLSPVSVSIQPMPASSVQWVIFTSGLFESESAALETGTLFSDALLVAGALGKLGVDTGLNRFTLRFGEDMRKALEEHGGREIRGDGHGLAVYPDGAIFVTGQAHLTLSVGLERFEKLLSSRRDQGPLTNRQRNCALLLNDSFFPVGVEAQFVLRISAVEALCEQRASTQNKLAAIQQLQDHLQGLSIDAAVKTSLQECLRRERTQSVRQAYKEKFRTLLDEKKGKAFDRLYGLRSKLLHEGAGRGDLGSASHDAMELAIELFEAEITGNPQFATI